MLKERDVQRLIYIEVRIERIERYVHGELEQLLNDGMVQDAVLRRLETLTDASNKLPDEVHARDPEVAWRRIKAFRNVAAHVYEEIDMLRIWDILENYLPALRAAVEAELQAAAPSAGGETG